jgi:Pretoxin HINT domain
VLASSGPPVQVGYQGQWTDPGTGQTDMGARMYRPGTGGESFTADTKVLLASGKAIPIARLQPGQKVLATNTRTGRTRAETISAVMVHHDTDLYDLVIRAGIKTAVIDTTRNHPFWDATAHRWIKASALRHGSHLRTPTGGHATVVRSWIPQQSTGWMWDLTIPGDHDFYIDTPAADILVHNCNGATLHLTYKPGWTQDQIAAADAKVSALNDAAPLTVTAVERSGSAADAWRAAGKETVEGADIDHTVDLQLGGYDEIGNMSALDRSVNRSLGAQISAQIKQQGLRPGDTVCRITIGPRC